jgi:pimeloyl-ACP methyl ester carboxylesterase
MSRSVADVVDSHRLSGRIFEAGGVDSFVVERGDGAPVVCLHGVPASSFLYRKVLTELAGRGLRGVAFDFPGLGLAGRPADFDYSWSGLASWTGDAIDALGIDRCHLVVHDIGGPIGFEWAITHPERVLSLTVLNSPVDVAVFRRPWPMHPFSIHGVGQAWLASMRPPAFGWIFRHVGIADDSAISDAEVDAYVALMKRGDGGNAFLKIMRGFELTRAKQDFFYAGLRARPYPAQVVWGQRDRMLADDRRRAVQDALALGTAVLLPARHFLQEDQAPAIATAVADLVHQK